MANNGGVVKTWTANNASSVTGTYADWYSTGDTEWIIEVTGTTSIMTITSLGQLHREEIVQSLHLNAFVLVGNLCVDHVPLADGIQILRNGSIFNWVH